MDLAIYYAMRHRKVIFMVTLGTSHSMRQKK